MNLKKGTPACGLILGTVLVVLGALVMWIGFWKTLVLALLFALGYFFGAIDQKREFLKNTANKLIPEKEINKLSEEMLNYIRQNRRDLQDRIKGSETLTDELRKEILDVANEFLSKRK